MQRIVVVGASLAGLRAVEALRRSGFDHEIVWIGEEAHLPYDRPPLSKEVLRGEWDASQLALRKQGLDGLDVQLKLGTRATGLDVLQRIVRVGAEQIAFDGLVIATGARARRLPDTDRLKGVHVIRTLEDSLALRAELANRPKVAVIGAGFIGAEAASSARSLGLDVTLIEALPVPLGRVLGYRMGQVCAALHRDQGVDLRTGVGVKELVGDTQVRRVRLNDGSEVEADVVIVGIGVLPNVEWLRDSGALVADGVECDAACNVLDLNRIAIPGVVAAGDVARFFNPLYDESMRVEHWTHSVEQAEHAVATLLGTPRPFETAPVFWSDQYGLKIQFAGRSHPDDTIHVCHGSVEERRFVALYGRAGRLVGALTFRRPAQLIKYRGLIQARASFAQAVSPAS